MASRVFVKNSMRQLRSPPNNIWVQLSRAKQSPSETATYGIEIAASLGDPLLAMTVREQVSGYESPRPGRGQALAMTTGTRTNT